MTKNLQLNKHPKQGDENLDIHLLRTYLSLCGHDSIPESATSFKDKDRKAIREMFFLFLISFVPIEKAGCGEK